MKQPDDDGEYIGTADPFPRLVFDTEDPKITLPRFDQQLMSQADVTAVLNRQTTAYLIRQMRWLIVYVVTVVSSATCYVVYMSH